MSLLSSDAIESRLKQMPGWKISAGQLEATFTLPSFAHALLWMGAVGQLAEAANHHPDLFLHAAKQLGQLLRNAW